jgi:ABC-type transport system substrate-binding protein
MLPHGPLRFEPQPGVKISSVLYAPDQSIARTLSLPDCFALHDSKGEIQMNTKSTRAALFTMSQLSRRQFLQGLALTSSSNLLVACIPAVGAPVQVRESQSAGQTSGPSAAQSCVRHGAMFRDDVPNLDVAVPHLWPGLRPAYALLYNPLYTVAQDGQLVTDLAAELPAVSEDGLICTIPLRKDVKFHNGAMMTAQDVKFTFDRQFWPELRSPAGFNNYNIAGSDTVEQGKSREVSGVEIVDEFTIRLTFKRPVQEFFWHLLTLSNNGIVPKKAVEVAGADWGVKVAIGTGPFKLVEWLPGDKIIFERYTEYFKSSLPYLDRIEVYLNTSEEAVSCIRVLAESRKVITWMASKPTS